MRSTKYGLGLAVAAACMALGASNASAATVNVSATGTDDPACGAANTPCGTIPYAHDLPSTVAGDTIKVAAGTYTQGNFDVTKAVQIVGARAGVDAEGRSGAESVITNETTGNTQAAFNVKVSNVRIDGFTIQGQAGTLGAGIALPTTATTSGHRFVNNVLRANNTGIALNALDGASTTLLRGNLFDSNNQTTTAARHYGLTSAYGISNVIIDQNTFRGHTFGAFNMSAFGTNPAPNTNIDFTDNTVQGQGTFGNASDLLIEGNTIHGLNYNFTPPGPATALFLARVSNATVRDNTLDGNAYGVAVDSGASLGVSAARQGPGRDIDITGNTFPGAGGLRLGAGSYVGTLNARFNRIVATTNAGVSNGASDARVDARNNWWGSNAGAPLAGANRFEGDGDATPHLILRLTATPDLIQTTGSSTLKADLTGNSDGDDFTAPPFPSTPVVFSVPAANGAVSPTNGVLTEGIAKSVFTASGTQGAASPKVTLDGQDASTSITVRNPTNGNDGTGTQGPAGTNGSSGLTPSSVTTKTKKVVVNTKTVKFSKRSRKARVRVTCPRSDGLCEGTLKIVYKGKVIGRQAFLIRGARSGTFTIKLSKSQLKKLGKGKTGSINVFSRDRAGTASSTSSKAKLKVGK